MGLLQAATSKKKAAEDKKSEKTSLKDSDKQQASAANAAAAAAFGSKAQKWGAWSTAAAKNPVSSTSKTEAGPTSSAPDAAIAQAEKGASHRREDSESKQTSLARPTADAVVKKPFLPPSRVKAEMLSAKLPDLVAALEGHPMYQKSSLLYKLYDQLPD